MNNEWLCKSEHRKEAKANAITLPNYVIIWPSSLQTIFHFISTYNVNICLWQLLMLFVTAYYYKTRHVLWLMWSLGWSLRGSELRSLNTVCSCLHVEGSLSPSVFVDCSAASHLVTLGTLSVLLFRNFFFRNFFLSCFFPFSRSLDMVMLPLS